MLDTTNVRQEITEARKTRDAYVAQRDALSTTIAKLDAYIHAAEALIEHLPAAQDALELKEPAPPPAASTPTLRQIVKGIMSEHMSEPMHEQQLYHIALARGAEERPTPEKGAEAVKYALYDLRKRDPQYRHMGEGMWTYTPF